MAGKRSSFFHLRLRVTGGFIRLRLKIGMQVQNSRRGHLAASHLRRDNMRHDHAASEREVGFFDGFSLGFHWHFMARDSWLVVRGS